MIDIRLVFPPNAKVSEESTFRGIEVVLAAVITSRADAKLTLGL